MNHVETVFTVAITPDNRYIFAGDGDDIVKSDRRTGEEVKRRENAYFGGAWALFTDGVILVSCGYGSTSTLKVWNMDLELEQLLHGHEEGVCGVAIFPNSMMIVSGVILGR